jgi:hypothetical protein
MLLVYTGVVLVSGELVCVFEHAAGAISEAVNSTARDTATVIYTALRLFLVSAAGEKSCI